MKEYDDLSVISGIGPARQHWLSESLGINTFRGLALLSVTRAIEKLKADGHNLSASELEKWIAAAQAKLQEKQDNPAEEWKPVAVFVLEFLKQGNTSETALYRTIVHDMQGDISKKWSGLEAEQSFRWILHTLSEQLPEDIYASMKTDKKDVPAAKLTKEISAAKTALSQEALAPVFIEDEETEPTQGNSTNAQVPGAKKSLPGSAPAKILVEKLSIEQPLYKEGPIRAEHNNEPFTGDILGSTPFVLKAFFATQMEAANDLASKHYAYHAEFYADNRVSGQRIFLGKSISQNLSLNKANHTVRLSEVMLSSGTYRLHVLITVNTFPPARGHFLAPLLCVN